jgi:CRP-like cAMP-binding protein
LISIIQHGVRNSEILARRLSSMRGRIDFGLLDNLALDGDRRDYAAGQAIFDQDANHRRVLVLVSGVAGEARVLADGRRQILALRFPGDALTANPGEILVALTRVHVADGAGLMTCLADASPDFQQLRRAWVTASRTDQAILRDQVVRLGRMSAFERTAHMLVEVHERLAQVGLASEANFHLPLTQEMVSDVIGLSVVHLNRTLQALRREGLVTSRQGYVTLVDRARLVEIAAYVSRFPTAWTPNAATSPRRTDLREAVVVH